MLRRTEIDSSNLQTLLHFVKINSNTFHTNFALFETTAFSAEPRRSNEPKLQKRIRLTEKNSVLGLILSSESSLEALGKQIDVLLRFSKRTTSCAPTSLQINRSRRRVSLEFGLEWPRNELLPHR